MPKNWFVHLQGETFGPLSTDLVKLLLQQNRLQFADFVWAKDLKRWQRLSELTEFSSFMSPYPTVAPPTESEAAAIESVSTRDKKKESPRQEAAPAPAPSPQPSTRPKPPIFQLPIRRAERVPIQAKVQLEGHGTYQVMNISETGLITKAGQGVPVGVEVKFVLEASALGKPLSMTGVTIREGVYAGESGIAIEFTKVNPAHKRVLQDYVKTTLAEKAA